MPIAPRPAARIYAAVPLSPFRWRSAALFLRNAKNQ
jgi:hypothetical protein